LFWTILKKLWTCHLKLYKTFLKWKDNRMTSKDLKLQDANWSYVPTHMPMTPFTWRRHILLIPSLIWTIFVALDAPSKALQNPLNYKDNKETPKDLKSSTMQIGHMCQPICPWPPSFGEYLVHSFINLNDFCSIGCSKWRATKCFWAPKEIEQCTKIYKSLSLSYQHVYLSSCN
jgi:hypothetical protein